MSKQTLGFNQALGDMAAALNSETTVSEKLHRMVRSTALALGVRGCSLLLFDAQKKRLFHAASQGLSERYLRKGFLEAKKGLSDTLEGRTVAILDVTADCRIQFSKLAQKEGIVSILGAPVRIKGELVGALRAYSRTQREFTVVEEQFLVGVSDLIGVALESGRADEREKRTVAGSNRTGSHPAPLTAQVRQSTFAHPSEEDFARLLDFYEIEWVYEPRSFLLEWEGRVAEMFTPDFYLPALDL